MKNAETKSLLEPYILGDLQLTSRVVMAPLTRSRAVTPGNIPADLMREYYEQRATAGLIITEGISISKDAEGWYGVPGIYNEEQKAGWKEITKAVHAKGGHIFAQLWHQGSVSLPLFFDKERRPLAPSAVNPVQEVHTADGVLTTEIPYGMTKEDIRQTVADFRHAAQTAKEAGFDGVQIQGGFIYLIQQFLHEPANLRTDEYGGSIENRARFLFEVLEAVLEIWPGERVGVKTGVMMNETGLFKAVDSTKATTEYVFKKLSTYNLSHLMIMRQMADISGTPIADLAGDAAIDHARKFFTGNLIVNAGIDHDHAAELIANGSAEMIGFGREYIANPDLVERIRTHAALNPLRPEGFYGGAHVGYTDYPFIDAEQLV